MAKGKAKKVFKHHRQSAKNSAVTFDPEERKNYLKGMIGAKKRRREFYMKKME